MGRICPYPVSDARKKDEGYAALLENKTDNLASSHQIKRFFVKLSVIPNSIYCKILHELFNWRLHIEKPAIIELGIDTMVLDNDTSKKRKATNLPTSKLKDFNLFTFVGGHF